MFKFKLMKSYFWEIFRWDKSATITSNALYNTGMNRIILSSGILQPPFFDVSFPPAHNFGSIGAIIGHELIHGFDNNGRLHDRNGNLRKWWSDDTIQRFEERAECFKKQYSNFTINGQHIDGKKTLGIFITSFQSSKHFIYIFSQVKTLPIMVV